MNIKCVFFDLDGTLYPARTGLWMAIKQRIDDYLQTRMHFTVEQAQTTRRLYFEKYGTTLRGLQLEHNIDPQDYLDFVHDLPIEEYLHPDPAISQLIQQLKTSKWIFTNSDSKHALRTLSFLKLENEFDGIIDIYALDFICKPQKESYLAALKIAQQTSADECLFIDDSPENILGAKELGFVTVLVSENGRHTMTENTVHSLEEIRHLFPELWIRNPNPRLA